MAGNTPAKYWINVVSRDHVMRGKAGGFTQANHGKPHMLRRMKNGDWIIFYSPKTAFEDGQTLQAFTAIGQIVDDDIYEVTVSSDFHPWRRQVIFYECRETLIRPLLSQLECIKDIAHWGYSFRFGVFEIQRHDFRLLTRAMECSDAR